MRKARNMIYENILNVAITQSPGVYVMENSLSCVNIVMKKQWKSLRRAHEDIRTAFPIAVLPKISACFLNYLFLVLFVFIFALIVVIPNFIILAGKQMNCYCVPCCVNILLQLVHL